MPNHATRFVPNANTTIMKVTQEQCERAVKAIKESGFNAHIQGAPDDHGVWIESVWENDLQNGHSSSAYTTKRLSGGQTKLKRQMTHDERLELRQHGTRDSRFESFVNIETWYSSGRCRQQGTNWRGLQEHTI